MPLLVLTIIKMEMMVDIIFYQCPYVAVIDCKMSRLA